jgi:hypothetical protein
LNYQRIETGGKETTAQGFIFCGEDVQVMKTNDRGKRIDQSSIRRNTLYGFTLKGFYTENVLHFK